jgi:hypothetical protein
VGSQAEKRFPKTLSPIGKLFPVHATGGEVIVKGAHGCIAFINRHFDDSGASVPAGARLLQNNAPIKSSGPSRERCAHAASNLGRLCLERARRLIVWRCRACRGHAGARLGREDPNAAVHGSACPRGAAQAHRHAAPSGPRPPPWAGGRVSGARALGAGGTRVPGRGAPGVGLPPRLRHAAPRPSWPSRGPWGGGSERRGLGLPRLALPRLLPRRPRAPGRLARRRDGRALLHLITPGLWALVDSG